MNTKKLFPTWRGEKNVFVHGFILIVIKYLLLDKPGGEDQQITWLFPFRRLCTDPFYPGKTTILALSTPSPPNLLSSEQLSQMVDLMNCYSRLDPPLTQPGLKRPDNDCDDYPGRKRGGGREKQPDKGKQRRSRPGRGGGGGASSIIRTRQQQRMGRSSAAALSSSGPQDQPSLPASSVDAPWLFGPHLSTKEIIRDIKPLHPHV